MRRARAVQISGLFLIPTPVFGVDSSPWMGHWVGGWHGAIWDDFSSWACPFLVGDIDRSLCNWGYGMATLFAQSDAFQGCMHCEIGTLSWEHGDTFSVSAAEY